MSSPQPDPSASADIAMPQAQSVQGTPPVPQAEDQPQFQLTGNFRYKPRRNPFDSKVLRLTALVVLLVLCGVAILALVQRQTGTSGLLVGVCLAVLPVPLVLGAFYWLDRVEPKPLRNLLFCFAWGACAATLVAILANTWATSLLISHQIGSGETLGASLVAPLVEESAKGSAILLLFLFRRRDFSGIVDGVVYAGFTATGFAFTENILYIGRSVLDGNKDGMGFAQTVVTFILREVMSPFAHPLFTSMTGVGFGIAAMTRKRWIAILAPIGGWICAMFMHGTWNGSSVLGPLGFIGVYFLFMVPVFGLMVWLVVWSRRSELKVVERQLPVYAAAGWIAPPVPLVLSAMRTRRQARDLAKFTQGSAGDKAMREYLNFATSLAFLRQRAERGLAGVDFVEREQELLHHLWERRDRVAEVFARVGAQEWYRTHPQTRPAYGHPGMPPMQGPAMQGVYGVPRAYGAPGGYPAPGYATAPAPFLPAQPVPGYGGYPAPGPVPGGYGYPAPGPVQQAYPPQFVLPQPQAPQPYGYPQTQPQPVPQTLTQPQPQTPPETPAHFPSQERPAVAPADPPSERPLAPQPIAQQRIAQPSDDVPVETEGVEPQLESPVEPQVGPRSDGAH
ncbi:RsiW-degrading membrane proteinase PrsW (M82 family) [Streptacidiphilus sp. MAP12-16]|uniref:PrsW family intramembrane metalloprotease n=1 Tax=Streptacidiphilus sp. MAP12-16 TaxID=3156300 RepID=UPI0035165FB5